jgi:hypothetical protein
VERDPGWDQAGGGPSSDLVSIERALTLSITSRFVIHGLSGSGGNKLLPTRFSRDPLLN